MKKWDGYYNDAISILNEYASEFLNTTYATSARCVGTVPNNPSSESGFVSNYVSGAYMGSSYKYSDTNYLTDWNQMLALGISSFEMDLGNGYWLGSRDCITGSSSFSGRIRSVFISGDGDPRIYLE